MIKTTIPTNWKQVKLSEISGFITKGATPTTYGYKWVEEGITFLRSECVSKNGLNLSASMKISNEANSVMNRSQITTGDLLMTITGNVGRVCVVPNGLTNANINQHIAKIRVNSPKETIPQYIYYFLNREQVRFDYSKITTGQAYPQISLAQVRDTQIDLPPLPEQEKIVDVLETWDSYLEKLSNTIKLKKKVKKGLMQKLLTGKVRLPGFSGLWEKKKLGEVAGRITTGKLDANAMVKNGEYRFYTCAKNYCFIDKYAFDTEALLVSGNGANVGYIHYYKGKFNAYQRTYVLSDFSENILFIKLFMDRNLQERIRVEVKAGNMPYITMDTLSEMAIIFPPTIEEQTAIANILITADQQIEALKKKKKLIEQQQKFLLNNLVTGKIRVPELES